MCHAEGGRLVSIQMDKASSLQRVIKAAGDEIDGLVEGEGEEAVQPQFKPSSTSADHLTTP